MFKGHIPFGTIPGTGAVINVELGFTPTSVRLFNENGIALEWLRQMGDGKGIQRIASGAATFLASNGVSKYAGGPGAAKGFTLGTATINGAGETIHYYAIADE